VHEWIYLFDKAKHKACAKRHKPQFVMAVCC